MNHFVVLNHKPSDLSLTHKPPDEDILIGKPQYLKDIDEKFRFLLSQFRLCPKAELVTLRLVAACVALPQDVNSPRHNDRHLVEAVAA